MKKFRIILLYDASELVEVEAETEEEAIDKAHQQAMACLCHQCANHLSLGDIIEEIVDDLYDAEDE